MSGHGGTGHHASNRTENTLSDNGILKSLGEQIDVEFKDYAQWERTPYGSGVKQLSERPKSEVTNSSVVIVGKGRKSSSCHGKFVIKDDAKVEKVDPAKAERIKILRLRIKARKQTIEDYHQREKDLIESNSALKDQVEEQEKEAHENVKQFLRKYEKFRGGIITLNQRSHNQILLALKDFEETKDTITSKLQEIQYQMKQVNRKLKATQKELYTLHNYKDKEYPVKALQINDLQKEIQHLKISNEDEVDELEHLTSTMMCKIKKEQNKVEGDFTSQLTEESFERMHPTLKDMALQNLVMNKEKQIHTSEINDLKKEINDLKEKLKKEKKEHSGTRELIFPELFPNRPKCLPDMDVILDIPRQQWLPI